MGACRVHGYRALQTLLLHLMLEYTVCRGASADVAHADKQDRAGFDQNRTPSIDDGAVAVSILEGQGCMNSILQLIGASSQAAN